MSDFQDVNRMGWELLIHKYLYYVIHQPILEDWEFDILEKEWELKSGRESEVGFPLNKPSAQLIIQHGPMVAKSNILSNLEERRDQIHQWRSKYV